MENSELEEAGAPEASNGGGTGRTPPYISFKTLLTFLGELKTNGIPPQIDRSVLTRFSGGVQSQLMLALRSLGLVEGNDNPTATLEALVEAYETDQFKSALGPLIKNTYPYVFELDLMSATPSMFAKSFSENLGAKEDVLRKCRTFFLHAAKEAGIPIGTRIETAKFPRPRSTTPRKPRAAAKSTEKGKIDQPPPPPPLDQTPISEKALEYRLVDLMSEAAGDTEVMTSIINVITFLKTKDAQHSEDDE